MKHEEIKPGAEATRGHCGGEGKLSCSNVCSSFDVCEKPSNFNYCADATNLKSKADVSRSGGGKNCCGGGTLAAASPFGGSCAGSTSLCDTSGETLR